MRITEKNYCGYDIKNRKLENDYTNEEIFNALQKLGKYEDLEDSIGCPLEVYFKMCVFGTTLHTTRHGHPEVTQEFKRYIYNHVYRAFCLNIQDQLTPIYFTVEYGRAWALTKEELKNDKETIVTKTINGKIYFHPGYYIKEYLETQKISIEDFAKQLSVTPNYINKIINGKKDISYNIANKLHKLLGTSINFWINLQNSYNKGIKNVKEN